MVHFRTTSAIKNKKSTLGSGSLYEWKTIDRVTRALMYFTVVSMNSFLKTTRLVFEDHPTTSHVSHLQQHRLFPRRRDLDLAGTTGTRPSHDRFGVAGGCNARGLRGPLSPTASTLTPTSNRREPNGARSAAPDSAFSRPRSRGPRSRDGGGTSRLWWAWWWSGGPGARCPSLGTRGLCGGLRVRLGRGKRARVRGWTCIRSRACTLLVRRFSTAPFFWVPFCCRCGLAPSSSTPPTPRRARRGLGKRRERRWTCGTFPLGFLLVWRGGRARGGTCTGAAGGEHGLFLVASSSPSRSARSALPGPGGPLRGSRRGPR